MKNTKKNLSILVVAIVAVAFTTSTNLQAGSSAGIRISENEAEAKCLMPGEFTCNFALKTCRVQLEGGVEVTCGWSKLQ